MGQGALSKPVVQWWLSLNSSSHMPRLPGLLAPPLHHFTAVAASACGRRRR